MRLIYAAIAAVAIGAFGYAFWPSTQNAEQWVKAPDTTSTALAEVSLPATLSSNASVGKLAIKQNARLAMG